MAPTIGDFIPEGTLAYFDADDKLQELSVHSFATGKKVVLFGVPGAFTPPSVNDPFVLKAWGKAYTENKHVKFLADVSGSYTQALGPELDLSEKGLGIRSRRFAPLVDDLKVKFANIEQRGQFTLSSAEEILKAL